MSDYSVSEGSIMRHRASYLAKTTADVRPSDPITRMAEAMRDRHFQRM